MRVAVVALGVALLGVGIGPATRPRLYRVPVDAFVSTGSGGITDASLSANCRFVAFATSGRVYVHDRL